MAGSGRAGGGDMAERRRVPGPASAAFKKALMDLDRVEGKVGWFKSAHYPDGTPVAYVAAIQEHGSPEQHIPPRLGMRATGQEKSASWNAIAFKGAQQISEGKMTATGVLELVTQRAAGDMRKHITGPIQPPLKPDTVRARLRRYAHVSKTVISVTVAHPLTDTKVLLNTLTNTVEPVGKE